MPLMQDSQQACCGMLHTCTIHTCTIQACAQLHCYANEREPRDSSGRITALVLEGLHLLQ